MSAEQYHTTYDRFWREIVEPHGRPDWDQVKRELHDYAMLLNIVPVVYEHITRGRITKPNTLASEVIAEAAAAAEELLEEARREWCEDVGIDPGMPLEELRQALAMWERVKHFGQMTFREIGLIAWGDNWNEHSVAHMSAAVGAWRFGDWLEGAAEAEQEGP